MRAVVQRVSRAAVRVDGAVTGEVARGLLVLLGVGREDGEEDEPAEPPRGAPHVDRASLGNGPTA